MNLTFHCLALCTIAFFTLATPADAQYITSGGKQITAAAMDRFLEQQLDSLKLPALSIALITNGKIVYRRTLGMANISNATKADDRSLFEAASLSKPVFAYLVMKQVEKGVLHLDTPFSPLSGIS